MTAVQHLQGRTFHGRKGAVENRFSYAVDYLLLDPENAQGPRLFSRNRRNLTALHDTDHGGAPGKGSGVAWLRDLLTAHGLPQGRVTLLAQPRVLGHVFNPVSFWLVQDRTDALRVVVAEVTNTYGDRHAYLCTRPDHSAIRPEDAIQAQKLLHVSPFQPVEGAYVFRFDIRPDRIGIRIDYGSASGGLIATLTGPLTPLTNAKVLQACLTFGSRRVLGLIYWQALKLWWKGARFHDRPLPAAQTVSVSERP